MKYRWHIVALVVTAVLGLTLYRIGPSQESPTSEEPPPSSAAELDADDQDDSSEEESNWPGPSEASDEDIADAGECELRYPELLDLVSEFESVYYGRSARTSGEQLRTELEPLVDPDLLAGMELDVDDGSNASQSLATSTISATANPSSCDVEISGTLLRPSAYIETEVTIRKFENDAEVSSFPFTHETWWDKGSSGWQVVAVGIGAS